jgi:Family of unknown function (DUF6178)
MLDAQEYHKALVTRHPFWAALSPTAIKQRINQILAAPDSEKLVQALSPLEYMLLVKEATDARPLLFALAQPQQIRLVLDLDCWDKDTVRSIRVLEWLEELYRSGDGVLLRTLQTVDLELLIVVFRQHIRVHAALPHEEEEEPIAFDEVLANELYRVEFVDQNSSVNDQLRRLLQFLQLTDLDFYHHLMQGVMWGQDAEIEEQAYRWKSGRLQDEGFPDYYTALETHSLIDLAQLQPMTSTLLPAPGLPESAEASGLIPSYAWSLLPTESLLARALSYEFPLEVQERLCGEMVYLCNRELVVDQVDFADVTAVYASLLRVHAYLNLGIEHLHHHTSQQAAFLLTVHPLHSLYQIGFTLCMRLHQRALRLQTFLNREAGIRRALPGLARQVVDGLLHKPPRLFVGLLQPGETGYRDFWYASDIPCVEPILFALETDPAYHAFQRSG